MAKYGKRENYDLAIDNIKKGHWRIDPEEGKIFSILRGGGSIGVIRGGYVRVRIGYKGPSVSAHRVIWEYVYGPSDLDLTINHIDGDPLNNKISNLELKTNQQNIQHAIDIGIYDPTISKNKGGSNGMAKLDEEKVKQIKCLQKLGVKGKDLAKEFGVSQTCISQIKSGVIWGHVNVLC